MAANLLLPESGATGVLAFASACSTSSGGKSFRNCDGCEGNNLPVFLPAAAVANRQCLHGARDGHIKEPPLLVERVFFFGTRVRQKPFLQTDDVARAETPGLCNYAW